MPVLKSGNAFNPDHGLMKVWEFCFHIADATREIRDAVAMLHKRWNSPNFAQACGGTSVYPINKTQMQRDKQNENA